MKDGFYIDYSQEPLYKQAEWNPKVKKILEEGKKSFEEYLKEEMENDKQRVQTNTGHKQQRPRLS